MKVSKYYDVIRYLSQKQLPKETIYTILTFLNKINGCKFLATPNYALNSVILGQYKVSDVMSRYSKSAIPLLNIKIKYISKAINKLEIKISDVSNTKGFSIFSIENIYPYSEIRPLPDIVPHPNDKLITNDYESMCSIIKHYECQETSLHNYILECRQQIDFLLSEEQKTTLEMIRIELYLKKLLMQMGIKRVNIGSVNKNPRTLTSLASLEMIKVELEINKTKLEITETELYIKKLLTQMGTVKSADVSSENENSTKSRKTPFEYTIMHSSKNYSKESKTIKKIKTTLKKQLMTSDFVGYEDNLNDYYQLRGAKNNLANYFGAIYETLLYDKKNQIVKLPYITYNGLVRIVDEHNKLQIKLKKIQNLTDKIRHTILSAMRRIHQCLEAVRPFSFVLRRLEMKEIQKSKKIHKRQCRKENKINRQNCENSMNNNSQKSTEKKQIFYGSKNRKLSGFVLLEMNK